MKRLASAGAAEEQRRKKQGSEQAQTGTDKSRTIAGWLIASLKGIQLTQNV
jgi:hypothetical protein